MRPSIASNWSPTRMPARSAGLLPFTITTVNDPVRGSSSAVIPRYPGATGTTAPESTAESRITVSPGYGPVYAPWKALRFAFALPG